ncbi:hypothetical protein FJR47_05035 [Sulfurimonas xiamenensis]|uniref:Uncharacterized protein n=1 Tax=Sulfurimonas xiamenensis TaxID=2590021 RepID=A0AAJ4DML8_9BACT|nr:hypothetical protein FJR47_05035 [Sulfurimonas xiamenensis]
MQRSISNQNSLTPFLYVVIFIPYIVLSSIHLFLPPLLAILYVLFSRALKKNDLTSLLLICFSLVLFEAEKGYVLFSTLIYFAFIYRYIIPKIAKIINCNICVKMATVILVYIGFFVFNIFLSNIFLMPSPSINYYVIYYIIIEFFILSIL